MTNNNPLHNINQSKQPLLLDLDAIVRNGDPKQEVYLRIFENLQGNILKDHGRDHALHFFLKGFPKGDDAKINNIKRDIQNLAEAYYRLENKRFSEQDFYYVASAKEHYLLSRLSDKDEQAYGKTYFVNIAFSRKGYDALGYPAPNESSFSRSLKAAPARFERENRGHIREPIPMTYWEEEYDNLDAMILVAHQDKSALVNGHGEPFIADVKLRKLINAFRHYFAKIEFGHVMYDKDNRDPKKKMVEHFGFQDGISNPFFFKSDGKKQEDKSIEKHSLYQGGYSSAAPLELVLIPDPNCHPTDHAYGSYLVFAKLEQDVAAFHTSIKRLASTLNGTSEDEKINRAKALVMGRFPDGTPIALQSHDGGIKESNTYNTGRSSNNFGFDPTLIQDPDLQGPCPLQAHIRRANPRNVPIAGEVFRPPSTRRIVRRGITYGNREKEPKDSPIEKELPSMGDGNGLLFMCFQANIADQFEWILTQWILYFEQSDAVVSDQDKDLELRCNKWPKTWKSDPGPTSQYCFGRHVALKGGEYFFVPSIPFLRGIANPK